MVSNSNLIEEGLISVIMSNYNTPLPYLKQSIDSILNQTYSNIELIIIDDGSTDNSLDFIKSYDDSRIKLICNEKNIGLTRSLNKGLEVCTGEYIARMDTDDICYPERFEIQSKYMREHPDTIVCGSWAIAIDEDGNYTGRKMFETLLDRELYRVNLLFGNRPVLRHPSAFFNHSLLMKYSIKYNEKYRYAQDYRMWIDCSQYADCTIIPEILLKYRIHNKAISKSKQHLQKETDFLIIQEQLDRLNIVLPNDLKPIHRNYLIQDKSYDERMIKWLHTIIKANQRYKIYNHKILKKVLYYRWSEICYSEMAKRISIKRSLYILKSNPIRCYFYMIQIFIKKRQTNK